MDDVHAEQRLFLKQNPLSCPLSSAQEMGHGKRSEMLIADSNRGKNNILLRVTNKCKSLF
jgi:hypothetical protein